MTTAEFLLARKLGTGGGGDITIEQLNATENGTYSEQGKAYSPVIVEVPQPSMSTLEVSENGNYDAPSGTGYNRVEVNVPLPSNAYLLKSIPSTPTDIATILDGAEMVMPSLTVGVEPQQDLHGYDSPWVGGAGKNKCDLSAFTHTGVTADSEIVTTANNRLFSIHIPIKSNTDYTLSMTGSKSGENIYANRIVYFDSDDTFIERYVPGTTQITTFTTLSNAKYLQIDLRTSSLLDFEKTDVSKIQLEEGSSATSFAPYSNICPISGWSEVNVVNMDDITNKDYFAGLLNGTYGVVDMGTLNWSKQQDGGSSYFRCEVSDSKIDYNTYNFINFKYPLSDFNSVYLGTVDKAMASFNGKKIIVADSSYSDATTFKNSLNGVHLVYELATLTTPTITPTEFNNLLAEFGIDGCLYTIDLDGTRYGGYIEIVNGQTRFVATKEYIASYNGETLPSDWISDRDVYSEGATPTIGAEVVYNLATPIIIPLSPTPISTNDGINNIFANSGQILDGEYLAK